MIKLNKKELREIEEFIKDEVEAVIFATRRSRGKVSGYKTENGVKTPILNGGNYIEDKSGQLRRKLRANKNFIKQSERGLEIKLEMVEYYKYLDDERRDELNWYLSEAIFESPLISGKIKEVMAKASKRVILKMISDTTK